MIAVAKTEGLESTSWALEHGAVRCYPMVVDYLTFSSSNNVMLCLERFHPTKVFLSRGKWHIVMLYH